MTDDLRNGPPTETTSEQESSAGIRDESESDSGERRAPTPEDAAAKPDDGGSLWQRIGSAAPDAADIEDPDNQL